MSFCLWQSRADARAAAGKPDHIRAVSLLEQMYESYLLEYLTVRREPGGPLTFEPYPLASHQFGHPAEQPEPAGGVELTLPRLGIDPSPA